MRVNFYSYDDSFTYEYLGCIYEHDGKLVSKPEENAVLRKIISEPLELPGQTISPSETKQFLDNLQKRYNTRDFAASHSFPIEHWMNDGDTGLADWKKPGWEEPVWEPMEEREPYVKPDGAPCFDEPREGEIDDGGCFTEAYLNRILPPIPDWMRKPPPIKNKEQPGLFDED